MNKNSSNFSEFKNFPKIIKESRHVKVKPNEKKKKLKSKLKRKPKEKTN